MVSTVGAVSPAGPRMVSQTPGYETDAASAPATVVSPSASSPAIPMVIADAVVSAALALGALKGPVARP